MPSDHQNFFKTLNRMFSEDLKIIFLPGNAKEKVTYNLAKLVMVLWHVNQNFENVYWSYNMVLIRVTLLNNSYQIDDAKFEQSYLLTQKQKRHSKSNARNWREKCGQLMLTRFWCSRRLALQQRLRRRCQKRWRHQMETRLGNEEFCWRLLTCKYIPPPFWKRLENNLKLFLNVFTFRSCSWLRLLNLSIHEWLSTEREVTLHG